MDLIKPSLPSGSGRSWKCSIMTLTAKMWNFWKIDFFQILCFFSLKMINLVSKKNIFNISFPRFKKNFKIFLSRKFSKKIFFSKIFFFWSFLWKNQKWLSSKSFWELLNNLPFPHFISNIFIFLGYWVLWHLHCLK